MLNDYEKSGLLEIKYYDLLEEIGTFINKYEIDTRTIKKSTINKINYHHRLHALNKPCFREPEDEINIDYDEDDEIASNHDKNDKIIIDDKDHINDLRIILKEAIKNNDRDLIMCTMNYLNILEYNKKKIQ